MSLPSLGNAGLGSPDHDSKQYFEEQRETAVVRKTLEERQAQLQEALKIDPGVKTWSTAGFYVRIFYRLSMNPNLKTSARCTLLRLWHVSAAEILALTARYAIF